MADRMPYRYQLVFDVIVEGDGQHADGDGAEATRRRLREAIEADPRVVAITPGPMPRYVGPNTERER